jgi:hypothetical protein
MVFFELLPALFMVVAFIAGLALLIADRQSRREPVRQESGAWRRRRR